MNHKAVWGSGYHKGRSETARKQATLYVIAINGLWCFDRRPGSKTRDRHFRKGVHYYVGSNLVCSNYSPQKLEAMKFATKREALRELQDVQNYNAENTIGGIEFANLAFYLDTVP